MSLDTKGIAERAPGVAVGMSFALAAALAAGAFAAPDAQATEAKWFGSTYAEATDDVDPVFVAKGTGLSNAAKITWPKVSGATKYEVWASDCNGEYIFVKIKSLPGKSRKFVDKSHSSFVACKYFVVAKKGKKAIARTPIIHVAFKGNTAATNAKKVTLKTKPKVTKRRGKTFTVRAKATPIDARKNYLMHTLDEVRYVSSDRRVATVGLYTGKVTLKKPGKVKIYALAENGAKVTVDVTSRDWAKPSLDVTDPKSARVGIACSLDVFDKKNVDHVTWRVEKDGVEVDPELAFTGTLGMAKNEITFASPGTYTFYATGVSKHGKTATVKRTIVVYSVPGIDFDLPATTHTDKTVALETTIANATGGVTWTLTKDGKSVNVADYISGDLTDAGGNINFKQSGAYVLTGTVTDSTGYESSWSDEIVVYPVIEIDLSSPAYAYEGDNIRVSAATENLGGHSLSWELKEGATATDPDPGDVVGELSNKGGTLHMAAGTYRIYASVTDETGRTFTASTTTTVLPVVSLGVVAPEYSHVGYTFPVEASWEGVPTGGTVTWTAKLDGADVVLSDVVDGTLGDTGGTLTAKVEGDLELTATYTDASGQTWSDSATVKVLPVPSVTFSMPETAWTDTEITVSPTVSNLGDSHIEWLVDNTYGFQDWDTFVDGTLTDSGGTMRYKHAGTFTVVARVTDASGEVFLFEMPDATTEVQPVLSIDFDLPDFLYAGQTTMLRTSGHNPYLPVVWTLTRDGVDVELKDVIKERLNDYGGDISFAYAGTYTLTATMTDVYGRTFTHSDTVEVATNITANVTSTDEVHIGENIDVALTGENIDGCTVDWKVTDEDGNEVPLDSGTLDEDGGVVVIDKDEGLGTYRFTATVTDKYGTSVSASDTTEIVNRAPAAPTITASYSLSDMKNKYTTSATARASVSATSTDPDGDEVTIEYDTSKLTDGDYVGLGSHVIRARAVDTWGATSEWAEYTLTVTDIVPSAPSLSASVDYNDSQNAYSTSAKAKVTASATVAAGDDAIIEWSDSSEADDSGAYLGQGTHAIAAHAVGPFGTAGDDATMTAYLGVVGKADPAGTVYAEPTGTLSSSTLGSSYATSDTSIEFTIGYSGTVPTKVSTIDFYNQSAKTSELVSAGSGEVDETATYEYGKHVLVSQVKDFFGAADYANRFFIVSESGNSGDEAITGTTTTSTDGGLPWTDPNTGEETYLATVDSFSVSVPAISGHSSGSSDYLLVTGTYIDSSGNEQTEEVAKVISNDAQSSIDSTSGTYSSDVVDATSFTYTTGKYVKLDFEFYSPHESCMQSGGASMTYSVSYEFTDEAYDILASLFD